MLGASIVGGAIDVSFAISFVDTGCGIGAPISVISGAMSILTISTCTEPVSSIFRSTVIFTISLTLSETATSIVSNILSICSCVTSGNFGSSSISTITTSVSSITSGKSTVISVISDSTTSGKSTVISVISDSGSFQSPALLLLSLLFSCG